MIKESELRVGNWVKCPSNDFFKYCQVTKRDFALPDFMENCSPITLTVKILEKSGFDKRGVEMLQPHYTLNYFTVGLIKGKLYRCYHGEDGLIEDSIELKHVHQLQNLYFYLTGEELQINL